MQCNINCKYHKITACIVTQYCRCCITVYLVLHMVSYITTYILCTVYGKICYNYISCTMWYKARCITTYILCTMWYKARYIAIIFCAQCDIRQDVLQCILCTVWYQERYITICILCTILDSINTDKYNNKTS